MSESRIVRHDPALGLNSVFRVLAHRNGRPKLDVLQVFDGVELHWRGPDALGPPEETLLYAILDIAAGAPHLLGAETQSALGISLRRGLQPTGLLQDKEVVTVETSLCELARRCGYDAGGAALRHVRTMLRRMVEVTLWLRYKGIEGSSRLLYWMVAENLSIQLAINLRLSAAVLGEVYSKICLAERQALSTHVAKTLHARLSAQLREGRKWDFQLPGLEQRVWGNAANGSTRRSRHAQLREALGEIGMLARWHVVQRDRVYSVTHCSASGRPMPRKSTDDAPEKHRHPAAADSAPALGCGAIEGRLLTLQSSSVPAPGELPGRLSTTRPLGVEKGADNE